MEELPDEDDIDLEALQAQIDLSLAHTKNLVSSWLKPAYGDANVSQISRVKEEKEIEELLRRPPRLGVGAPIPASTSRLGNETIKLKNKLVGKKRTREEDASMAQADNSDEEDESRAGAIKKKARQDPFARTKGKKKKKGKAIPSNPVKVDGAGSVDSLVRPRVVKGDTPAATRDEEAVTPVAISTFTSSLSPKNQTATKPSGKSPSVPKICPEANPSPFPLNHLHKSKGPPTHPSGDAVISPRNAKSLGSPSRSPKAYVAIPVLNLDGPPPQSESPPKKRRKKRKKKKSPVQRSDV